MNAIHILSVSAAIMLVVVPSGWAGQESVPAREGPVSITAGSLGPARSDPRGPPDHR